MGANRRSFVGVVGDHEREGSSEAIQDPAVTDRPEKAGARSSRMAWPGVLCIQLLNILMNKDLIKILWIFNCASCLTIGGIV